MPKLNQLAIGLCLLLVSCGSGGNFNEHVSAGGLMPEKFLPAKASMVLSYSLMDDKQNDLVTTLMEKVEDKNQASKTVSQNLGSSLDKFNLDYEKDLAPAFGDRFRMVYETAPGAATASGEVTNAYTIITLADPVKLKSTMDFLVSTGKLEKKSFNDYDAYVSEVDQFYSTINQDLFFISDSADGLITMRGMTEDASLWASDTYQASLKNVGSNHVFYVLLYPENVQGQVSNLLTASMASVLNEEGIVLRAQKEGLKVEGFATADQEKAKAAELKFDNAPKKKAYLLSEVPSENLMVYAESYGFQQSLTAGKLTESEGFKNFSGTIQSYLGMNLETEILSFMDKGFVISANKNGEAVLPGISILFDISSDTDNAKTFITKIDAQISGFMTILTAALPGAVTKDKVEINGVSFDSLMIDLSKIPRTGTTPLPSVLTASPIQLSYGILGDKLLITTSSTWMDKKFTPVKDSDLYKELSPKLEKSEEGLLLVNLQEIGSFAKILMSLREQMGLPADSSFDLQKALDGFYALIASSETKSYEAKMEGFLELSK